MQLSIEDNGTVELTLKASDGTQATQSLDLWEAYCVCCDANDAHRANPEAGAADWLLKVRDWLVSRGWPQVSLYAVKRFTDEVLAAVGALKKKEAPAEETPSSPDSTEQPS